MSRAIESRRESVGRVMRLALVLAVCLLARMVRAEGETLRGLPFTRSYPLEEIGNVWRGARLSFDGHGRLAVIQLGAYLVLNDTTWVNLADDSDGLPLVNVVPGPDGRAYFAGRASWGVVQRTSTGRLRPLSFASPDSPAWTRTTSFDRIVSTSRAVYFSGPNGVVCWDLERQENHFFPVSYIAEIFRVGERVYVSPHGGPLLFVDCERGALQPVPGTSLHGNAVAAATELDEERTLLAVRDGTLQVFDGVRLEPWAAQARNDLVGQISALHRLVDGGVAVAITGRGLFLVSSAGELTLALTAPQYHRITYLATREPGVLWVGLEDSIEKVLYGSAVTSFGQRLGLPVSWPLVARWRDRIMVASSGTLYQAVAGPPGSPSRFEAADIQVPGGAWAMTANETELLLGNTAGVYRAGPDGRYTQICAMHGVNYVAMIGPRECIVVSPTEIAALRWADGRWSECAPRIAGFGQAWVAHAFHRAVWIESGGNRVGRVTLKDGQLTLRTFELPWSDTQWVNVGLAGETVVLSGPTGHRAFFDEKTEQRCEAPQLERLLARAPAWISRVREDETGRLWATHSQGIVTFTPRAGGYEMDAHTFDLINDLHPVVHVLPGNDVWVTGGRSLQHVELPRVAGPRHPPQPRLVSIVDERTKTELFNGSKQPVAPLVLRNEQNNLSFRLFSGTYAWRRAPQYEFRLKRGERWTALGSGSLLNFTGLSDGLFRLEVRIAGDEDSAANPIAFEFEVLPPWHRTGLAYAGYGLGLVLAVLGVVRWAGLRARRRNAELEHLVLRSTSQLKVTMEKLNEETRNAATLAERHRLAGEIHDSLQQGLSGLMLQLDATLKLSSVADDVRSRLSVARSMVSFTRHEVQHAVWDMESPLLADTELGEALRKLTALIDPGGAAIEVVVTGPAEPLPPRLKHHLLRIAQEAITNGVRHAAAQRIAVRLEYAPGTITLAVLDNGVGFEPAKIMAGSVRHFGLRGLRGRAAKISGELLVQSSPGQGTLVRIVVPLAASSSTSSDANPVV